MGRHGYNERYVTVNQNDGGVKVYYGCITRTYAEGTHPADAAEKMIRRFHGLDANDIVLPEMVREQGVGEWYYKVTF